MAFGAAERALVSSRRGVLFDVDGTLVDSWRLGFDATQVVLERNDVPAIDEAAYHDGTRYCTPERLARHAGLDPADPPFAEVGARLAAEFDDLYVGLVSTETAGFFAGIDDLLEGVVGTSSERARVGVLTNACVAYAARVLEVNLGDGVDTFSSVRGADNVPAPKPAADGLLRCCEDLGLRPDECVYVGDSPSDARAAEAAGMPSIGVDWGSHSRSSLEAAPFLHVCSTVEELKEILPKAKVSPSDVDE